MNSIKIHKLTSADSYYFSEGLELLSRTQGRGLFADNYLDLHANGTDGVVFGAFLHSTAAVANKKYGELVGIGVAKIIKEFEFYLPFDANIVNELSHKKVAGFSTLAVREDYQGQGIGTKISHERMKWIKEKNCDVVLGLSWVSGKKHTSDRVFEKMGFKPVKRIDDFFVSISIERNFICPTCGNPPCRCATIFYRLDLI